MRAMLAQPPNTLPGPGQAAGGPHRRRSPSGPPRRSRRPDGRRRRWPLARPVSSSADQADPHLLAQRGAAPTHLVGQGSPAGRLLEQGTPGFQGAEEVVEEGPAVHRLRRPAHVVQAGAPCFRRAGPGHVDPDAHDHDGSEGRTRRTPPRPGPRPAWRRRGAGRWATSAPARPRPPPGRRPPRPGPPPPHRGARRRPRSPGRRRTEASRFAPGGDSQRRSRRPRPAVWWSATATSPAAAPWRARSRT